MRKFGYFYKIINLLSLDVAVGALASLFFATYVMAAPVPRIWYYLLPLSVWLVYTADHLLDAYRLRGEAKTLRHKFHYRFFLPIFLSWGIVLSLVIVLSFLFLPIQGWYFGLLIVVACAIHFFTIRYVGNRVNPWLWKEMAVAAIYTMGIWGIPWLYGDMNTYIMEDYLLIFQFFCLSLLNLLTFSLIEMEIDRLQGQSSFVRGIGVRMAERMIEMLLSGFILLGVGALLLKGTTDMLKVQLILLAMWSLIAMLYFRVPFFTVGIRYRLWGDAAFFIPGLILAL